MSQPAGAGNIKDEVASVRSEAPDEVQINPRKRKKSSRACDFCHVNHQPCDNAKPRCGYCEKHNKSCLYLRPQKKRGPAQGYRSALHTMRESAAAWGAALNMIPSLGPVIEGYLKQSEEGRRLSKAIKDPQQQEFFIQAWQQSSVFKAFFGDESGAEGTPAPDGELNSLAVAGGQQQQQQQQQPPPAAPPSIGSLNESPAGRQEPMMLQRNIPTPSPSYDGGGRSIQKTVAAAPTPAAASLSLSDIMAKDAAIATNSFSQTLGSLGFAPDETLDDFLAMTNQEGPADDNRDTDPSLGTDIDQKAYYELLMGKQFT